MAVILRNSICSFQSRCPSRFYYNCYIAKAIERKRRMKRKNMFLIIAVLMIATMSTALAGGNETNYAYGFTAQCISPDAGYSFDTESYKKTSAEQLIDCRANVIGNGAGAGYTVFMMALDRTASRRVGGRWQQPNTGTYLPAALSGLTAEHFYSMGGRGNTKYNEFLGLQYVRIEGQFRVH